MVIWKDESSGAEETPAQKLIRCSGMSPEAVTLNVTIQFLVKEVLSCPAYHVLLAMSNTNI